MRALARWRSRDWARTGERAAFLAGASAAAGFAATVLARWKVDRSTANLTSRPDPAADFGAAARRFELLASTDGPEINPECHSRLLHHGHQTDQVVILVHGITNCPKQYVRLAPLLHERGFNVLVPRMPRHGLLDRTTHELKNLTAEELRDFADAIADMGAGLGRRVTIVGLSAGGVVAAWVAQHRADVDRAVLVAPSIGIGHFGARVQYTLAALALTLPDLATQRLFPNPRGISPHGYVGFSTRSLGQVLRLAAATVRGGLESPPAVQHVAVVTNANDSAVSNALTRQLVSLWQSKGLRWIEAYEFPKQEALIHDLIDPAKEHQKVETVYPVLLDLLSRSGPPGGRQAPGAGDGPPYPPVTKLTELTKPPPAGPGGQGLDAHPGSPGR